MSFEEKLIELVKSHPNLYDKRHPSYPDYLQAENSWKEIAKALGLSTLINNRAKERWVTLRQRYAKDLRKIRARAASGAKPRNGWQYYDSLTFLEPFIDTRSLFDCPICRSSKCIVAIFGPMCSRRFEQSLSSNGGNIYLDSKWRFPPLVQVDSDTEGNKSDSTPTTSSSPAPATPPVKLKVALRPKTQRKLSPKVTTPTVANDVVLQPTRNEMSCIILKPMGDSTVNSPKPPPIDMIQNFLNGLAPSLRNLSPGRQLKARKMIQNIVFDLEEEELMESQTDPLEIPS